MKGIIYNDDTGEILSTVAGDIDVALQVPESHLGLLVDEAVDSERSCIRDGRDIPSDLTGKKVHTGNYTIVDDPDYEEPRTKEDIRQDLADGVITHEEAVEELLSL